jgi:hypothetical protein|tara:strand:+ start:360 stop:587 length:228 start_codon:yes stop_codon:yes gene_type:complete
MKLTTKRFVIRKTLIGQNAIITFTNKKNETYTYDHDAIYSANQEKFETMECFQKYGNYTNSNNVPTFGRQYLITK